MARSNNKQDKCNLNNIRGVTREGVRLGRVYDEGVYDKGVYDKECCMTNDGI